MQPWSQAGISAHSDSGPQENGCKVIQQNEGYYQTGLRTPVSDGAGDFPEHSRGDHQKTDNGKACKDRRQGVQASELHPITQ